MRYRYDAVCGLYCGACGAVLADKDGSVEALAREWGMRPEQLVCHGCRTDVNASFCQDCGFKSCAGSKGIEHCSECDEFPCAMLVDFGNDGAAHHSVVLRNSEAIREHGLVPWLEQQRQRWTCSGCGAPFSWYDRTCKGCGAALRDCRTEEHDLDADEGQCGGGS